MDCENAPLRFNPFSVSVEMETGFRFLPKSCQRFRETDIVKTHPYQIIRNKKWFKFNIIQTLDNCIVGRYKPLFLFEGATCQKLAQKRKAAE